MTKGYYNFKRRLQLNENNSGSNYSSMFGRIRRKVLSEKVRDKLERDTEREAEKQDFESDYEDRLKRQGVELTNPQVADSPEDKPKELADTSWSRAKANGADGTDDQEDYVPNDETKNKELEFRGGGTGAADSPEVKLQKFADGSVGGSVSGQPGSGGAEISFKKGLGLQFLRDLRDGEKYQDLQGPLRADADKLAALYGAIENQKGESARAQKERLDQQAWDLRQRIRAEKQSRKGQQTKQQGQGGQASNAQLAQPENPGTQQRQVSFNTPRSNDPVLDQSRQAFRQELASLAASVDLPPKLRTLADKLRKQLPSLIDLSDTDAGSYLESSEKQELKSQLLKLQDLIQARRKPGMDDKVEKILDSASQRADELESVFGRINQEREKDFAAQLKAQRERGPGADDEYNSRNNLAAPNPPGRLNISNEPRGALALGNDSEKRPTGVAKEVLKDLPQGDPKRDKSEPNVNGQDENQKQDELKGSKEPRQPKEKTKDRVSSATNNVAAASRRSKAKKDASKDKPKKPKIEIDDSGLKSRARAKIRKLTEEIRELKRELGRLISRRKAVKDKSLKYELTQVIDRKFKQLNELIEERSKLMDRYKVQAERISNEIRQLRK